MSRCSQALGLPRQFLSSAAEIDMTCIMGEELLATIVPQTGGQAANVLESSSTDRPAGAGGLGRIGRDKQVT